jgi:ATP-dependent RNA helicase DeaD
LTPTPIPTAAEVAGHRVSELLGRVPGRLADGRLRLVRNAVEAFVEGSSPLTGGEDADGVDLDSRTGRDERTRRAVDLATAVVALAVDGSGPAGREDEDFDDELAHLAQPVRRGRASREQTTRRTSHPAASVRAGKDHYQDGAVAPRRSRRDGSLGYDAQRYWVGVGHRDGARPGAIVGALTSQSNLRGQDLGSIQMFATYSIVEITPRLSRQALQRLSQARVAGRALHLRPDTGQAPRRH